MSKKHIKNQKKTTDNIKSTEKSISKFKNREILEIIPILIIVFFLPFIIRLKVTEVTGNYFNFWTGARQDADLFTYYKKVFIYISTLFIFIQLFFFTPKFKKTRANYIIGVFAFLTIISSVFSKYREIALHGFIQRNEGMWVWLSYLVFLFFSMNIVSSKKQISIVSKTFAFSGIIIAIISILQTRGFNIFETEFIQRLIIPSDIREFVGEASFRNAQRSAYGVFYNPNYLGGYMGFFAPFMFSKSIIQKKSIDKIIYFSGFSLGSLALLFSNSEAGVLGYLVSILFMSIIFAIKYLRNKKEGKVSENNILMILPIIFILVFPMISLSSETVRKSVVRIYNEAVEMLFTKNEPIDYKAVGPLNKIENISDSKVKIVFKGEELFFENTGENVLLLNEKNETIHKFSKSDTKTIDFKDKDTPVRLIYPNPSTVNDYQLGLRIRFKEENSRERLFLYLLAEKENLIITDYKYQRINPEIAPYFGFEGKGRIGSGRGYIWSRSIPLLKDSILIGSGADTFITRFPRNDIYAKQVESSPRNIWTVTDKPHNTYLQIGIHQGVLALLISIFSLIYIIIKGTAMFLRGNKQILSFILAILSFMISSFFNDSIIGITPIIMIIIGISIGQIADFEIKDKGGKLDAK